MRAPILILFCACTTTPKPVQKPEVTRLPNVSFEVVDGSSTDTGYWPTFLRDPQGGLHLAYCDAAAGDAKMAHETAAGWEVESIDTKGAVGKYITGDWGPDGPEVVYLDQTKKTLRYAWKEADGWKFQNLTSDNEDLGISGRFRIGPAGERVYLYYNTRNDLILSVGKKVDKALVWETNKIAKAGVVHNIVLDLAVLPGGRTVLAFPDWNVSRSTLNLATSNDWKAIDVKKVDDEAIAGLKTQLVPNGSMFDILYMTGRGGKLYLAKAETFERQALTDNVANLAAAVLADGALGIGLQVGKADGLGEGAVHYAERSKDGVYKEWLIDDVRPVGQYLAIAASKRGRAALAYYDGVKKGLKVARIP